MSNIEEAIKYKNLGNECFSAQKYEEAIQHFSKAIELNPNDHVFFSNRSACYASLEQYEQALEDATRCVTLKPEWSKGYTRKGLAEFYLEKYEDAEKTYETGLQLDPSNQQLKEGLERVKEAKTEGGADASGNFMQGNFMQQAFGKLLTNPETAAYFQDPEFVKKLTAIQKNPQMIGLYMNDPKISKAFQVILGDFGGAGGMFGGEGAPGAGGMGGFPGAGAGAAHGDDHHDHSNCGPHGHSHEKPAATEEAKYESEPFFKPKETKPEPPKAKAPLTPAEEEKTKGNDEYKKKNFDKAIGHYLKATELDPSEPIYYNNLAAVYLEKKEYDKAIECCDKAEEICKSGTYDYIKFAKVLARKASAYVHKGDLEKGLDLYSKSLLENNDAKVKEDMKKVEKLIKEQESKAYINPELAEQHRAKGNELYGQGKFPDAIKEYDEAIRRNPTDAKLYANRATGLMKLMEYPTALKDIDRCIELDPTYVKAYAKKGVIHHFLKEYHKAIESYEKGLQLDPNNEECKSGVAKTRMQIMGASGESKEDQAARFKRAMEDPEIRAILQDPQIMQLLRDLQERPQDPNNSAALRDPTVSKKIDKLIAAGVLRMG